MHLCKPARTDPGSPWREWWGNHTIDQYTADHRYKDGLNDDKDGDYIPNKVEDIAPYNKKWDPPVERYDWDKYCTPIVGRPDSWNYIDDFEDMDMWENRDAHGDHSQDWADPGMNHKTEGKYND